MGGETRVRRNEGILARRSGRRSRSGIRWRSRSHLGGWRESYGGSDCTGPGRSGAGSCSIGCWRLTARSRQVWGGGRVWGCRTAAAGTLAVVGEGVGGLI